MAATSTKILAARRITNGGFSAGESAAPRKIKFAVLRPCDDKQDKAKEEATAILNAFPKVKLIMAICSPAVPGAAEAVRAIAAVR